MLFFVRLLPDPLHSSSAGKMARVFRCWHPELCLRKGNVSARKARFYPIRLLTRMQTLVGWKSAKRTMQLFLLRQRKAERVFPLGGGLFIPLRERRGLLAWIGKKLTHLAAKSW